MGEEKKPEEWAEGCFVDMCEEGGCGNKNRVSLGEVTKLVKCKGYDRIAA